MTLHDYFKADPVTRRQAVRADLEWMIERANVNASAIHTLADMKAAKKFCPDLQWSLCGRASPALLFSVLTSIRSSDSNG